MNFEDDHCDDRVPGYLPFEKIDWSALDASLSELQLFDDPYLRMQATNVSIVGRGESEANCPPTKASPGSMHT